MRIAGAVCVLLLIGACSATRHHVEAASPEVVAQATSWVGPARQEECGIYILGFDWPHLFVRQTATRGRGERRLRTQEERRALYHALESIPAATHLAGLRSHTATAGVVLFGHPIFGERCATVEAIGVAVNREGSGAR